VDKKPIEDSMCGRVAQTASVVEIAARKFSAFASPRTSVCDPPGCNFNLSPGMDCDVLLLGENGDLQVERKKWGLITKNGTANNPLYTDESEVIKLCFESLCFNARSETLYSKPTFSNLAHRGRTCIIAIDGYFEWRSHPIPKMNKTKQPYFVYRKHQSVNHAAEKQEKEPLLIAGIWTNVSTGIKDNPELGSFAMLTIDASEQIKWLHRRMPLCIWNIDLAKEWLTQPSEALKKMVDDTTRSNTNNFGWHKVTPKMSKLSFRSKEAIMEIKGRTQSIKYFFSSGGSLAKNSELKNVKESQVDKKVEKKFSTRYVASTYPDTIKGAAPFTARDGKRQRDLPSDQTRNFKKNKQNRSPTLASNNQILINSFFVKR